MAENRKQGILYGVGVGPGDPELMTLKAVRILRECRVIGIPAQDSASCTAYQIALQAVPELADKMILAVPVPMTGDREKRENAYRDGCDRIIDMLETGNSVAFLNLGDPTIYSTYMYLQEKVVSRGYEAQVINGIPSFCAVAAKLGIPLGEGREEIHILPGCYAPELVKEYPGTKVLMKSGGKLEQVKRTLLPLEMQGQVTVAAVTNCGMEDERLARCAEALDEQAGYFTTILVKDR